MVKPNIVWLRTNLYILGRSCFYHYFHWFFLEASPPIAMALTMTYLFYVQSTHMASQQITEEAVYLCTGNPMPKDIEQIAFWLLNEPFSTSFKCTLSYHLSIWSSWWFRIHCLNVSFLICSDISDMKMRKGLALVDIIREVTM